MRNIYLLAFFTISMFSCSEKTKLNDFYSEKFEADESKILAELQNYWDNKFLSKEFPKLDSLEIEELQTLSSYDSVSFAIDINKDVILSLDTEWINYEKKLKKSYEGSEPIFIDINYEVEKFKESSSFYQDSLRIINKRFNSRMAKLGKNNIACIYFIGHFYSMDSLFSGPIFMDTSYQILGVNY